MTGKAARRTVARRAHPVRPPEISRGARLIIRVAGNLYLRLALRVGRLGLANWDCVRAALCAFYERENRLLFVFRHVDTADGPLLMHAVVNRMTGVRRDSTRPHIYFLHGRDVLDWAGALARWIFPRLGGVPVTNAHNDPAALRQVRTIVEHGEHPLAFAPEMQVTYRTHTTGPMASGAAVFARWAAGAYPDIPVVIAPIAIGYSYRKSPQRILEVVIRKIETALCSNGMARGGRGPADPRQTLIEHTESTLSLLETIHPAEYALSPARHEPSAHSSVHEYLRVLNRRREKLCELLLARAEDLLQLDHRGETLERLFRVRYASSSLMYRTDIDPDELSPSSRAITDRKAELASQADHLQQIVDVLFYLEPVMVAPENLISRVVEYALNLLDVHNRIHGGTIDTRYRPRGRRALLLAGTPIAASDLLRQHEGKRAIEVLNAAVAEALDNGSQEIECRLAEKNPISS